MVNREVVKGKGMWNTPPRGNIKVNFDASVKKKGGTWMWAIFRYFEGNI